MPTTGKPRPSMPSDKRSVWTFCSRNIAAGPPSGINVTSFDIWFLPLVALGGGDAECSAGRELDAWDWRLFLLGEVPTCRHICFPVKEAPASCFNHESLKGFWIHDPSRSSADRVDRTVGGSDRGGPAIMQTLS